MTFDHLKNIAYVDSCNLWALDFDFDHSDKKLKGKSKSALEIYFSETTPEKKAQAEELIIDALKNFDKYGDNNRYSPSRIWPTELISGILEAKVISEKTALQAMKLLHSIPAELKSISAPNTSSKLLEHFKSNDMFMTALNYMPFDRISDAEMDYTSQKIIMTAIDNEIVSQEEIIKLVNDISQQASLDLNRNVHLRLFGREFKINTTSGLYIINSAIKNKAYDHKLITDSIYTLITSPNINSFKEGMHAVRAYAMSLMECVITELYIREKEVNNAESAILNKLTSAIESSLIDKCGVGSLYSESAHAFECKLSIMKINSADKNDINYEQNVTRILRKMKEPYNTHASALEQVYPIRLTPSAEEQLVWNTGMNFPIKFISMFSLKNQLHIVESNRIKESRSNYINQTKDRLISSKSGSVLLEQFDQLCFNELKSPSKNGDTIHTLVNLISDIKVNPFSAKTIELAHSLLEHEDTSTNKKIKSTWQVFLSDINKITISTAHDAPADLSDEIKQAIVALGDRGQKSCLDVNLYDFGSDEVKDEISKLHLKEILSRNTPRTGSTIASALSFLIYNNPTANGFLEQTHVQELIDSNFTREAGIIISVRAVLPFLDAGYRANLKDVSPQTALGIISSLADHAMMSEVKNGYHGVIATFVKKFLATTSINFMNNEHQEFNKWMSLNSGPIYEAAIAEKLQNKLEQQSKLATRATKRNMI